MTFTNTTGAPATGVKLSVSAPWGWTAVVSGAPDTSPTLAPGASMSATFKITSGLAAFNGDLVGKVSWTSHGRTQSETTAEKVRNVRPVKINEFRISAGSAVNSTDSFIELYNAGGATVDLSGWTLTQHPTQQAVFSTVKIPAETKLRAHGFYLLGLSNSGLDAPARKGDATIYVRNVAGMSVGDTLSLDGEARKIATVGTPADNATTLWRPLPDGPVITIPAGSTNLPVTSVAGFVAGEKIALGYGAAYPGVARDREQYEVATVTAIGKLALKPSLAQTQPPAPQISR